MSGMKKASLKDIWRSVRNGKKRFFAILIITALGMAMLTGLYAACQDMYYSADRFFEEQNLFDVQILSTLGLTGDDLDVLSQVEGVENADGVYSEEVFTEINGTRYTADMTTLSSKGLNRPYILSGALPQNPDEIAVPQSYLDESGKSVGDTLSIQEEEDGEETDEEDTSDSDLDIDVELEEESATFPVTTYTITGVVIDATNITNEENEGFRTSSGSDFTFFVAAEAVNSDVYTAVYVSLTDTGDINSFSDEYESTVDAFVGNIEANIKQQREQARYDAVVGEATEKLEDAQQTMDEKFADADRQLAEGEQELSDGRAELSDGEKELAEQEKNAKEQFEKARNEIQDGKNELAEKRQQAESEFASAQQQIDSAQTQLDESRVQIEAGLAQVKGPLAGAWPETEWNALVDAAGALAAAGSGDEDIVRGTATQSNALYSALAAVTGSLSAGLQQQLGQLQAYLDALNQNPSASAEEKETVAASIKQLEEKKQQLDALPSSCVQLALGMGKINGGQAALDTEKAVFEQKKAEAIQQMDDAAAQLTDGEEKLNAEEEKAWAQIAQARQDIADGKNELTEGEEELNKNKDEYLEKKAEAEQKLADGYDELSDIDMTKWYVQDRTSLESYSSLKSDMSSIEAVGTAFPIVFLLVAILISLTTMTRMVEEERGLIGTYKALGFRNADISKKYLVFAFAACLLGGLLGDILGFIFMPKLISYIFDSLYILPEFYLQFDLLYGIGGIALFMAGIVGATAIACRSELQHMPAALMRPKAPRAGARVFMERIPIIWNRMKFLSKVTVRNLFRYKKRFFMTIIGIAGCTALVLCGFAIRDSVNSLTPKQYDNIYQYDLMVVADDKDYGELSQELSGQGALANHMDVRLTTVGLINSSENSENVQLMVVPDDASLDGYINILDLSGNKINLGEKDVLVTRSAANTLGLKEGDTIELEDSDLERRETVLTGVVQNYLGNTVYMKQALYDELFGDYAPNAMLADLNDTVTDQPAYAESLLQNGKVLSSLSTTAQIEEFSFDLINAVVLLLIVMAGGLAFVVLFTLSNTNISERIRELATIKVLGFYDREVHQYVNKETLILTLIGIVVGLPVGRVLSGFLTSALNMPSLYFEVNVEPFSYIISAVISFCFALIVNLMTNRTLNRIDMVEALKSIE